MIPRGISTSLTLSGGSLLRPVDTSRSGDPQSFAAAAPHCTSKELPCHGLAKCWKQRSCRVRYKFSLQNVSKWQRMAQYGRIWAIFDASSWCQPIMLLFSVTGVAADGGTVSGSLAKRQVFLRIRGIVVAQRGWDLAATRADGHCSLRQTKTCRQEWRHGTSGDVRHIADHSHCSRRAGTGLE